ncbi:fructosamine kinase family protein [Schaalia sp. lx-260]|uniref:fructosamine kinase family protein n=1 Tax=Schaalia sp. lx-260 TaxID=2899082 RepID=UPI001E4691B7|nr:fructosamine kinase family protein [Schaalia sp. lx-260]
MRHKSGDPSHIAWECAGLEWLREAQGATIVAILEHGHDWLTEPSLRTVTAHPQAAENFGRALARTHAAGASHFGCPPPQWEQDNGWMGHARLPLIISARHAPTSWGEFYAEYRILPYITDNVFTSTEIHTLMRLCERLRNDDFDHPQPALVQTAAARTHGDLWNGNIMWTDSGIILIDPAAQGNHAEEDLAQLTVFGCPHHEKIWTAYNEISPLADGWRERIPLHQLHMLMVHCALFGRSYVSETLSIAGYYT